MKVFLFFYFEKFHLRGFIKGIFYLDDDDGVLLKADDADKNVRAVGATGANGRRL